MNKTLETKIDSIFNTNSGNYSRLEISIECPLDSGLKATGRLIGEDCETFPRLGSIKDFFIYVSEYRNEHPEHQFNRMSIVASNSKDIDVMFSFDEDLQRQTMENIQ